MSDTDQQSPGARKAVSTAYKTSDDSKWIPDLESLHNTPSAASQSIKLGNTREILVLARETVLLTDLPSSPPSSHPQEYKDIPGVSPPHPSPPNLTGIQELLRHKELQKSPDEMSGSRQSRPAGRNLGPRPAPQPSQGTSADASLAPLGIDRRAAYQQATPQLGEPRDLAARLQRIEALRNQLRYPHALAASTLRYHLRRSNWDVNRAALSFWQAEDESEEDAGTQAARSTERRADTVEQGRILLATDQLNCMAAAQERRMDESRNRSQGTHPRPLPPSPTALTNSEIVLMSHSSRWVADDVRQQLGQILDNQTSQDHDLPSSRDEAIDNGARLRLHASGEMERDHRMAIFMTITASNSWWSCRNFLTQYKYDLVAAINAWMEAGGLPIAPSPLKRAYKGIRRPLFACGGWRRRNVNIPTRVLGDTFKSFPKDQQPSQLLLEDVDAIKTRTGQHQSRRLRHPDIGAAFGSREYYRGSRRGFLLDNEGADSEPAHVNAPDASKFWIEFMRRGRLSSEFFPSKIWRDNGSGNRSLVPFQWNNTADNQTGEVEFNWFDKKHVSRLNKWRSRRQAGITSLNKKPTSAPFNKYELQWLAEQEAMHVEEEFWREAGQDVRDAAITNQRRFNRALAKFSNFEKFPIRMPKSKLEDLTERFNSTFGGRQFYNKVVYRNDRREVIRKDMSDVGLVPRPERTQVTISQQRRRIKGSSKHFLITLNTQKLSDHGKFCDEFSSEEDSDFPRD